MMEPHRQQLYVSMCVIDAKGFAQWSNCGLAAVRGGRIWRRYAHAVPAVGENSFAGETRIGVLRFRDDQGDFLRHGPSQASG